MGSGAGLGGCSPVVYVIPTWVHCDKAWLTNAVTFVQEPADESTEWSALESQDEEPPRPAVPSLAPPPLPQVPSLPDANPEIPDLPQVDNSALAVTPPLVADGRPAGTSTSTAISPPAVPSPLGSSNSWTGGSSPWDPFSPRPITSPTLTPREAFLMRSFISKIAPWVRPCSSSSYNSIRRTN